MEVAVFVGETSVRVLRFVTSSSWVEEGGMDVGVVQQRVVGRGRNKLGV